MNQALVVQFYISGLNANNIMLIMQCLHPGPCETAGRAQIAPVSVNGGSRRPVADRAGNASAA